MNPSSKQIIESYYLETEERLFFAVKGAEHPSDRIIAVLRYAPDPEKGDRKKEDTVYRRLYHFAEQAEFLKASYPQYLAFDPVFQTTLQSVPRSRIRRIYNPCIRLRELLQTPFRKTIEEDAVAFCRLLQGEAGIPWDDMGITGSLLIGLHAEISDLDITIFGMRSCKKVYQALLRILNTASNAALCRLDDRGIDDLYVQRVADTPMDFQAFKNLEMRKVNQGSFRSRPYFVRFVKQAYKESESYGHTHYTPIGRAAITALIADDREAIFTPCKYRLSDVQKLEGPAMPNPGEIVSFRGRVCEQACVGECVMAVGTMERVRDEQGKVRHRLLLGNSPEDTMIPWRK